MGTCASPAWTADRTWSAWSCRARGDADRQHEVAAAVAEAAALEIRACCLPRRLPCAAALVKLVAIRAQPNRTDS